MSTQIRFGSSHRPVFLGSSSPTFAKSTGEVGGYDYSWMETERDGSAATAPDPTARWLSIPGEDVSGTTTISVGAATPSGIEKVQLYRFTGSDVDVAGDWTLVGTETAETTATIYGTQVSAYHFSVDTTGLTDGVHYFRAAVYARFNDGTNGVRNLWNGAYGAAPPAGGAYYPGHFARTSSWNAYGSGKSGRNTPWSGEYSHSIRVTNSTTIGDVYVDFATGNDSTGDGSSGNPYRHINKGLSVAGPAGSRVILKQGDQYFDDTSTFGGTAGTRWLEVTSENTTSGSTYSRIVGMTQAGAEGNWDPSNGGSSFPRLPSTSMVRYHKVTWAVDASDAAIATKAPNKRFTFYSNMLYGLKNNAVWLDGCQIIGDYRPADLSLNGWTLNSNGGYAGNSQYYDSPGTFSAEMRDQGFFLTSSSFEYQTTAYETSIEIGCSHDKVIFDVFGAQVIAGSSGTKLNQGIVPGAQLDLTSSESGGSAWTWTLDDSDTDPTTMSGTLTHPSKTRYDRLTINSDGSAVLTFKSSVSQQDIENHHEWAPGLRVTTGAVLYFLALARGVVDGAAKTVTWPAGYLPSQSIFDVLYATFGSITVEVPGQLHNDIYQVYGFSNGVENIYVDGLDVTDAYSYSQGLFLSDTNLFSECAFRNVHLNSKKDGAGGNYHNGCPVGSLVSLKLNDAMTAVLIEDCTFAGGQYRFGPVSTTGDDKEHEGAKQTVLRNVRRVVHTDGSTTSQNTTNDPAWDSTVGTALLPEVDGPTSAAQSKYGQAGYPGFPWTSTVTRIGDTGSWDDPANLTGGTGIRYEYS